MTARTMCPNGCGYELYFCHCEDLVQITRARLAQLQAAEATRDEYWADLCEVKAGTGVVPQALYDEAMKRAGAAEATLTAAREALLRISGLGFGDIWQARYIAGNAVQEAALASSPANAKRTEYIERVRESTRRIADRVGAAEDGALASSPAPGEAACGCDTYFGILCDTHAKEPT